MDMLIKYPNVKKVMVEQCQAEILITILQVLATYHKSKQLITPNQLYPLVVVYNCGNIFLHYHSMQQKKIHP